jgi:hypothetical protein
MASEPEAHLNIPKEYGSVTPSDISIMDEKEKMDENEKRASEDDTAPPKPDLELVESSAYPTSLKLFSILLAVVLSIFLVALDMVSARPNRRYMYHSLTKNNL